MSQISAAVPRKASQGGYRGRAGQALGFVRRFRKVVVAAALIAGDVCAAYAVIAVCRKLPEASSITPPANSSIALLVGAFFCLGLYTGSGPSPYERFRSRALGVAILVAVNLLSRFAETPAAALPVGILEAILLLLFGHYAETAIRAVLIRFKLWGAPTVVIGCGNESRKVAQLLLDQPALGLMPIGFLASPGNDGSTGTPLPLPLLRGGGVRHPVEFAVFLSASELSMLTFDPKPPISGSRYLLVEGADDIRSLWLRTRTLGGPIGIEIKSNLHLPHHELIKRVMDILIALILVLLVWPVIALLALAIKLVDPGPAFYVQMRVGRNATALPMLKLRTMCADAEHRLEEHLSRDPHARAEWNRFCKLSRDPRVLPIFGNFMRRASLDELPQLWNVIRGDMSLVGPRPFPAYHVGRFDDEFRAVRTSVTPGITGMWQISSRSNGDLQVQKAQDLFYIRNWSIWLDIFILLQTLPALLSARGAR